VADLQFKVHLSDQRQLPFPTNPVINSTLLKRVMTLGISQDEAVKLTTSYDEDRVTATLALMEKRLGSKTAPRIESTPAYFKQALKNNYAATTAVKGVSGRSPMQRPGRRLRDRNGPFNSGAKSATLRRPRTAWTTIGSGW
jgi:hypothetical protein